MILVTGGTGLIGSYLLQQLVQAGRPVRALCRDLAAQPLPFPEQVAWVQGDIQDVALLQQLMQDVTHVFHCAGLVSFAPQDARLLHQVNVEGTANVVNACLQLPGVKLCHVSSIAAIGKPGQETVLTEASRWEPEQGHSVYAASKHWGEAEVWRGVAEGLSAVIVNPSVVLGGTNSARSSTRLLRYVQQERSFYIEGEVNLVDVRDVVALMLQLTFSDVQGERFILTAGALPYLDFFTQVAQCLGKRPPRLKLGTGLARQLARLEHLRSLLTGSRPLITPDIARRVKQQLRYSTRKVEAQTGYRFRPLPETIAWACRELGPEKRTEKALVG